MNIEVKWEIVDNNWMVIASKRMGPHLFEQRLTIAQDNPDAHTCAGYEKRAVETVKQNMLTAGLPIW